MHQWYAWLTVRHSGPADADTRFKPSRSESSARTGCGTVLVSAHSTVRRRYAWLTVLHRLPAEADTRFKPSRSGSAARTGCSAAISASTALRHCAYMAAHAAALFTSRSVVSIGAPNLKYMRPKLLSGTGDGSGEPGTVVIGKTDSFSSASASNRAKTARERAEKGVLQDFVSVHEQF